MIVEISDLTKVYPTGFKANDMVNLEVREGEVVGLIGPNGAGKTTLIRQLLGILRPTSGRIVVLGKDVVAHPHLIKGLVGYVPQIPLSYPSHTVEEVVSFVLRFRGMRGNDLRSKVSKALALVGLEESRDLMGYQLSGGSIKLLLLAMALCQDVPLFVLDEPTAMVDVEKRGMTWSAIEQAAPQGVLLASHDMNEVRDHCTRVYIMLDGKMIAEGAPYEIAALLRTPVILNILPVQPEIAEKTLVSCAASYKRRGDLFEVSFRELTEALSWLEQLLKSDGVKYVFLEAPTMEKAVIAMLTKDLT